MAIIFTRACEYALQAMLYLALQPPHTPTLQRDISEALNIPQHFLGKVLQSLSRSRLVVSQKGKAGGFVIGKPPRDITPNDIIQAIDGPLFLEDCVLGFPGCSDEIPCPVHSQWKDIKESILEMLRNKNIEQLSLEFGVKLDFIKQHQLNKTKK